jgi:hypothetical protein
MARNFISSVRIAFLAVTALVAMTACYPTGTQGPGLRPVSGLVVTFYGATLDTYSIPGVTCQYRSNQFSGDRDCGLSYVGGNAATGFVFSAPQAQSPTNVTISAIVSVNNATPVDAMCDQPRFLDADVSYVSGLVTNVAQNEGNPNNDCEVRYSQF